MAARLTTAPALYMPVADEGVAEIVPDPTVVNVSAYCFSVNVAVTVAAPFIVTVQLAPLPEHPVQLVN